MKSQADKLLNDIERQVARWYDVAIGENVTVIEDAFGGRVENRTPCRPGQTPTTYTIRLIGNIRVDDF